MKPIPLHYWRQNYPRGCEPTFCQRWWVQRWLELTDPETSYWYSVPLTNTPLLLQELIDWAPYEGDFFQGRTLFFLLSEFEAVVKADESLKRYLTSGQWNKMRREIHRLVEPLRRIYGPIGVRSEPKREVQGLISDFGVICEHRDINPNVHSQGLLNGLLQELDRDKAYLRVHCDLLRGTLRVPEMRQFDCLDKLTQGLLVELIARHNFAFSHLRQVCLDAFLRPNMETVFEDRLRLFLKDLIELPLRFNVYMRVQARQIIREIGRIGDVAFLEAIPEMNRLAEDMRRRGLFSADQEEHAKQFFYGGEADERQVFAVVADIEAEDYGKAAIIALRILDQAIRQAKFEFEVGGFSIDNRMYVHNTAEERLIYFTKRQAQRAQYGAAGNPLNLERLLFCLSEAESNLDVPPELIEKVSSFALHWHRTGIEATAVEAKFLSHWFGLEQIFALIPGKIRGKNSASDKLVLALAQALCHRGQRQSWLDLWGDLVRCGFFGPSPLLSSYSGRVWFNESLRAIVHLAEDVMCPIYLDADIYYEGVQYGSSRPKMVIKDHTGVRQTMNVKSDTALYVADTEPAYPGQWLGGMKLEESEENIAIQELFHGQYPDVRNVWYLLYSSQYQKEELASYATEMDGERLLDQLRFTDHSRLMEALDGFGLLERLISDMGEEGLTSAVVEEFFYDIIQGKIEEGSHRSLRNRLQQVVERRDLLGEFLSLYTELRGRSKDFIDKHTLGEAVSLPTSLLRELYRGHKPDECTFKKVVRTHPDELAHLCEGQPLLVQRIRAYGEGSPEAFSLESYLWQVDRMRRARNALVHEVAPYTNLEILTQRLYQYSRVYLRKIIGRMANRDWTSYIVNCEGAESEHRVIMNILCLG
jgi:SAM-dependent methyltransferase